MIWCKTNSFHDTFVLSMRCGHCVGPVAVLCSRGCPADFQAAVDSVFAMTGSRISPAPAEHLMGPVWLLIDLERQHAACPKCRGYGFFMMSVEKRPAQVIPCSFCAGSGWCWPCDVEHLVAATRVFNVARENPDVTFSELAQLEKLRRPIPNGLQPKQAPIVEVP